MSRSGNQNKDVFGGTVGSGAEFERDGDDINLNDIDDGAFKSDE